MRIGRPIPFRRLEHIDDPDALIRSLRSRTYVLGNRDRKRALTRRGHEPLREPVPAAVLREDVAGLTEGHHLVSAGELDVYIARSSQVPNVMQEIGRLRELTFRAAGEGTGKSSDIDAFDGFYRHLFIWNREKGEIAGAYRLGLVDEILERYGAAGLYTTTLFRFRPEFFSRVGRSGVEMGRSFVRPEYQKAYVPLLLLWRGIATFVHRNPRYHVLFGPASISNDYQRTSRALLAQYLSTKALDRDLASHVEPRTPFRDKERWSEMEIAGFDDLQETLLAIESGQRGVPVLLRQYLNIGGRILALNVDREFSDVLDALTVVDLRTMAPKTLGRFMGNDEAAEFLRRHHGQSGL